MRKLLCIMLLVLLGAQGADAQTGKAKAIVASISKHYAEVKEYSGKMAAAYADSRIEAEQMMDNEAWPPSIYQTTIMQNLPGTGPHKETFRFFYYEEEDYESEGGPYFMRKIHFATVSYNFAARNYKEEYLFDEQGNLIYVYGRNYDTNMYVEVDFRLYFDKGKLIHAMLEGRDNEKDAFTPIPSTLPLQDRFMHMVKQYQQDAKKVKALFEAINTAQHS